MRRGNRLVGIGGRYRLAVQAFRASQRIKPQDEPFVAHQTADLRGGDH
jgi:hypothetical protein